MSGRIQPARARRRARARAGGKSAGNGTIALFPAGQRALDRQVRTRRGATYGIAAGEKSASRAAVRQRTQLAHRRRACRISLRAAVTPCSSSRSAGSYATAWLPASLPAPPPSSRSGRTRARPAGYCRPRIWPRSTASRCRIFRKAERTDRLTTRGARRGARRAGFRCASGGKAARPGHPT